jgi:hypothetical protein
VGLPSILITKTAAQRLVEIYRPLGRYGDELPVMGLTIQGAPIFKIILKYPPASIKAGNSWTDLRRDNPDVADLWSRVCRENHYKLRISTIHQHPMDYPNLSPTDIANFEKLRVHEDDPSTFPSTHPYPVLLMNLTKRGEYEILAFWVFEGRAMKSRCETICDDDPRIEEALEQAEPWDDGLTPVERDRLWVYKAAKKIDGLTPGFSVELLEKKDDPIKYALRVDSQYPRKATKIFEIPEAVIGNERAFGAINYIDWRSFFINQLKGDQHS